MRASDDRRQGAVATLRERALDGCLTLDAFAEGVGAAYRARTEAELDDLLADLPRRRGRLDGLYAALRRAVARVPGVPARHGDAPEIEVRVPRAAGPVTVGRSTDCDVVVGESTVSRVHAELRHGAGGSWTVRDLGSTNGTWLNGLRVKEAAVGRGDVLRLGGLRLDLV